MSDLAERVAALRALAADLEVLVAFEDANAAAKDAYRENPTETNKKAKQRAAKELSLAREKVRNSPVRDVEPGGVSLTPATVAVGSNVELGA